MRTSKWKKRPPFAWVSPDMLNDEKLMSLPEPEKFRLFMLAFKGRRTRFSRYVKRQWACPGTDTGISIGRG